MEIQVEEQKKQRKQVIRRVLVVLLGFAVIAGFILFDKDVRKISDVLKQIAPVWFIGAVGCVLLYYLGETQMYMIACKAIGLRERWYDGLITTIIGLFYSALTPLASGGQPFQVLQMKRRGISVGDSICVLMVKFLAWHVALSSFSLFSFIYRGNVLLEQSTAMFVLFLIGLAIHLFCATTGILLMINPGIVEKGGKAVIAFFGRLFNRRKPERTEKWERAYRSFVSDYEQATGFAKEHKGKMLLIILTALGEVIAYMATTYFIYRGLGFREVGFWEMTCLQAMLSISVAFIPTPGASIASEGGFYAIFTKYFGGFRLVGMLLWRVLTYYMTILIGLVVVIADGFRTNRENAGRLPHMEEENQDVSC